MWFLCRKPTWIWGTQYNVLFLEKPCWKPTLEDDIGIKGSIECNTVQPKIHALKKKVQKDCVESINQSKWVPSTHHVPLGTYIRPRPENDQQTNVIGQLKEVHQVPVTTEVVYSWGLLMVVPGDVPSTQGNSSQKHSVTLNQTVDMSKHRSINEQCHDSIKKTSIYVSLQNILKHKLPF